MSIEMKNAEILNALPALHEVVGMPMPAVASLKVARIVRVVETAAQEINQARQQAVERYTERDAEGNPVPPLDAEGKEVAGHVKVTDPAAFAREMEALLEAGTRLEVQPLRVEELGSAFQVSPRTLLLMGPLLEIQDQA